MTLEKVYQNVICLLSSFFILISVMKITKQVKGVNIMKRKTKAAAIFGVAAALSAGAAVTSLAAWEQTGADWFYTDSCG